jgi:hypothetical protein
MKIPHIGIAMRAKIQIGSVTSNNDPDGKLYSEQLQFSGVCASKYPEDGSDENNTFARFSPSINLDITVANPNLFGKFKVGDQFYLDFIRPEDEGKDFGIEEIEICQVPDFKQACDILRGQIGALDRQAVGLRVHPSLEKLKPEARGDVLANLTICHRHLEDSRMRIGKAIQHSETRESIFDIQKDPEKMARLAYKRYGAVTDFKNFQGNPMPEFDELPEKIKEAWKAAVTVMEPVGQ